MGLTLDQPAESIDSQHLQGAQEGKAVVVGAESGAVDLGQGGGDLQVFVDQLFAQFVRQPRFSLPKQGNQVVLQGPPTPGLEVDEDRAIAAE